MRRENIQMRKLYTKPKVVFENFSLSTNIASCEVHANAVKGSCGCEFIPGLTLFSSGIDACVIMAEDGVDNDGLCYHNPSDLYNIFKS